MVCSAGAEGVGGMHMGAGFIAGRKQWDDGGWHGLQCKGGWQSREATVGHGRTAWPAVQGGVGAAWVWVAWRARNSHWEQWLDGGQHGLQCKGQ